MLLRDAIHGDIELSPLATTLLDPPIMQRLRGIEQLGTAHLVYPAAPRRLRVAVRHAE